MSHKQGQAYGTLRKRSPDAEVFFYYQAPMPLRGITDNKEEPEGSKLIIYSTRVLFLLIQDMSPQKHCFSLRNPIPLM